MQTNAFPIARVAVLTLVLLLSGGCGEGPDSQVSPSADAEARLRAILELPTALPRAAALTALLQSLGPRDVPAVARAIDHGRSDMDEVAGAVIASWWTSFDPETAYAHGVESTVTGNALWRRTVLQEWALSDPEAVLRVVQEIPAGDPERVRDATRALISGWFYTDAPPDPLLPLIEPLPLGRARNETIDRFLNAMAEHRGVEATIEFVEAMGEGEANFKLQFYRRLATAVAQRDPQRAIAWAQEHAAGPYGANLLRRVGARWGWVAGEPAMEWALGLPASEERDGIVRETYRGFRMRARERADAWMRGQQPSPVLEPAYGIYLIGVARDDPREALRLLDGVVDETLKDRLIVAVARSWMKTEPEAAETWLQGAGLSSELARRVRDDSASP